MSNSRRILVVAHNHPRFHPGGTEYVAHSLFRHWRGQAPGKAYFLSAALHDQRLSNPGTVIQAIPGAPDEYLIRVGQYDVFHHLQRDKIAVFNGLGEILHATRPDVVHIHHFLGFGTELLPFVRQRLPNCILVLTIHDFYFACHNDGKMVKVGSDRLCHRADLDACHVCFPKIPAGSFKLRELNLKHHFCAADHFVAPSALMRDRLIDWGMDASRISIIRNGRNLGPAAASRPLAKGERRGRFAILGNVSPAKGQTVALQALRILLANGVRDVALSIHGAPLFQTEDFRAELDRLAADCDGAVRILGGYDQAELPKRLESADWVLMPSMWWENAPLVLDEAFHHGRPPICSDVGGMAERVRDGVDGLHFTMGDPQALAARIRTAVETEALWQTLRDAAPPTRTAADCASDYDALFAELAQARASMPQSTATRISPISAEHGDKS